MKAGRFFSLLIAGYASLWATIGPCGSCPGCLGFWPKVKASVAKIEAAYQKAENKSGKYYLKNIVPLEIVATVSERMIARMEAKIEMLDRLNILLREEMIREMEKQKKLRELITSMPPSGQ